MDIGSLPEGAAPWNRCCACERRISEANWSPRHTPLVSLLQLGPAVVLAGSQVGASSPGASSPTKTHMG